MPELTTLLGHSLEETVAVLDKVNDPVTAFAYISTPTKTTIGTVDTWHFFASTFTNQIASNVSGGTYGIQIDKDCRVEIEFEVHGIADSTGEVVTGIVKNPTFVDGALTAGTFLDGSNGAFEADTQGTTAGFGSMHSLWAGDLVDGDEIVLCIQSDVSNGFTPHAGAATLHQII